jgi:hypothetical protein
VADSIDLGELAACIRAEIDAMQKAYCNALQRALNAGDVLLAAQSAFMESVDTDTACLNQKGFTQWLRTHCFLKVRAPTSSTGTSWRRLSAS